MAQKMKKEYKKCSTGTHVLHVSSNFRLSDVLSELYWAAFWRTLIILVWILRLKKVAQSNAYYAV